MRTVDHREHLHILKEELIAFFEAQITVLREARPCGRSPAQPDYENSLRLSDDRFIAILQGEGDQNGTTHQYCVGRGCKTLTRAERFDRHASRDTWRQIAHERAPWVARALLENAVWASP